MRYTYVRQHDSTDCAAASLAMVCLHYKKEITITRLRDMMGTDMKGTNLVGLQKAANELGFSTAAVRVDRENFLSDFTLPAIGMRPPLSTKKVWCGLPWPRFWNTCTPLRSKVWSA